MSSLCTKTSALYINGEFLKGGGRRKQPVERSVHRGLIAKLPHATRPTLTVPLRARNARSSRGRSPRPGASRILRKVAELSRARANEIGRNITLDQGKPLAEAAGEVTRLRRARGLAAEECRRIYGRVIPSRSEGVRQFVLKEPIGVVAAFSPWNFPFNQAIRKIVSALGAGCTIIIKGPEDSPSAVVAIARMFHEAGLPPGCLNVVWGVPSEVRPTSSIRRSCARSLSPDPFRSASSSPRWRARS